MSTETDDLRDIFLDVAGEAEVTERQREGPSHDPVGDDERRLAAEIEAGARRDGLDDAIDGADASSGAA